MKSLYGIELESYDIGMRCWLYHPYPSLVAIVMRDHIEAKALWGVHGWAHTVAVTQYALKISRSKEARFKLLAGVAAICHNTDRLFPDKEEQKLSEYLDRTDLSPEERAVVFLAVKNHSKKNDPDDSQICVILKDADRLAGIGPIGLIRAAQQDLEFPLADLSYWDGNPEATFANPGSLIRNIRHLLEWDSEHWLRTPAARGIAAKHFKFLRDFQASAKEQFTEIGLWHWHQQ